MVFLVPASGIGPELLLRKGAHGIANHFLVLGEQHGIGLFGGWSHYGELDADLVRHSPMEFDTEFKSQHS